VGRRLVPAIGFSLALVLSAPAGWAAPSHMIGQGSIGEGRLGLAKVHYDNAFGAVAATTPFPGGVTRVAYDSGRLQVFMRRGSGSAILTVSQDFRTTRGVGPCSPAKALLAAYGKRLVPYRAARGGIVAYRLGHLVFASLGPQVTAVMLSTDVSRDLQLALTAAPCGGGKEG